MKMLCEAFAGGVGYDVSFKEVPKLSKEGFALWVALIEKTGVVEILCDPGFEILQVTKVDDETISIGFPTCEGEGDCPVMAVYERAVTAVPVLAVGEGNVAVGFATGQHNI
jgi:hypothetical protein